MTSPAVESTINRLAAQAAAERRRMLDRAADAICAHCARNDRERRSFGQLLRFARQRLNQET